MNKKDSWADRWFWAPEVYEVNGKFYMYYSADEHICVAVADSPVGPFIQNKQEPMIVEEKCIDNSFSWMMTVLLICHLSVLMMGIMYG